MYSYGLIGNCQISALISTLGNLEWLCMPRPDDPPVFGRLLDPAGGHFSFECESPGPLKTRQSYLPNTNILVTEITAEDGSSYRITDFCPRFQQHNRMYRPLCLFRKVEAISGSPLIRVSCQPINGWEKKSVKPVRGNSHVRYSVRGEDLRIHTNMPLTYFLDEIPFSLNENEIFYFGLTWGQSLADDLPRYAEHCLDETSKYWRIWVKHCSIPVLYQKEVIRSALALKLHCYEDTGAILAALTTSLPEEVGHVRNWDYRFCWLRDSYYTLTAFHQLGHFEEMEGFLKFLLNIAHHLDFHREGRLRPVYALDQKLPLPEKLHDNWAGYRQSSPVRTFNQAAEHVQNDVYGEMILALTPIFLDERFQHLRNDEHERLMQKLAKMAVRTISVPDAGLWELRDGWQEHSFSNLMCWAGIERVKRIRQTGQLRHLDLEGGLGRDTDLDLDQALLKAENSLRAAVIQGSLRNGPRDAHFDASLLQLPILRFPDQEVCEQTVLQIHQHLKCGLMIEGNSEGEKDRSSYLYRYLKKDDFGTPQSAFMICSFWLVQSLVKINRREEAKRIMDNLMGASNHLGLFAEHFIVDKSEQSGNFPQAYSHVGLINAAFALGPPWDQVL